MNVHISISDDQTEICSCHKCGTIHKVEWTRQPGFADFEELSCKMPNCNGTVFSGRCDMLLSFTIVRGPVVPAIRNRRVYR